jgi:hypothetical protein
VSEFLVSQRGKNSFLERFVVLLGDIFPALALLGVWSKFSVRSSSAGFEAASNKRNDQRIDSD